MCTELWFVRGIAFSSESLAAEIQAELGMQYEVNDAGAVHRTHEALATADVIVLCVDGEVAVGGQLSILLGQRQLMGDDEPFRLVIVDLRLPEDGSMEIDTGMATIPMSREAGALRAMLGRALGAKRATARQMTERLLARGDLMRLQV